MKFSNTFPLILFFIFALILAYSTNLAGKPNFVPSMVGKKVQDFTVEGLYPNSGFSSADFAKHDVTVINLFASWCVSCKAEHELVKKLAADGMEIYGVDVADAKLEGQGYLKENGNPYKKVGFDPKQQLAIALGAVGLPETFVIDKTGLIYFHRRGMLSEEIIRDKMLPVIEGIKKKEQAGEGK